jgi:hypothetical protein
MPYSGKEYTRKYRIAHREEIKGYARKFYKIHKELCDKRSRRWRTENPEKTHAIWRKFKYKITEEEFNKILKLQNNKCAICKKDFLKTPRVDHDHKTGGIRGLLCEKCNFLLGLCNEDVFILKEAIKYLKYTNIEKETKCELVILPPEFREIKSTKKRVR